jgi:phenylpropionate dioxygenase-like ring-hydroxylating dioxygenase large terminal subunit
VLFRDDAGKPHALLNRCCHRGVQLSLGKVVDGAIACRYHGWRYDGSGRCIHIPSLTADGRILLANLF